jgi:hypothetical protein
VYVKGRPFEVFKEICGEIWLPEVLFVYWWGKVAVAAKREFLKNKGYVK